MTDGLGLFSEDPTRPGRAAGGRRAARRAREQRSKVRKRRRLVFLITGLVLVLVAGAVAYGARELLQIRQIADYDGNGGGGVVIEVVGGDTATDIASAMVDQDVVASVRAFTRAAESDPRVRDVQPGFYQLRSQMSGAAAVTAIVDPAARVGQLDIRGGVQLDDVELPDGTVVPGIVTQLADASCATVGTEQRCVDAEALRTAMIDGTPADLGVPAWAVDAVDRVEPAKKLEGLVAPGDYDIRPGVGPDQLWRELLAASTVRLEGEGLPEVAAQSGYTAYEVLVIASIVEREGITTDFGRVSRVIYNRLTDGMPLQMDSTINYPLDRQAIRTEASVRAQPGPYNTYQNTGLPPSPIGSPGGDAVAAAVEPPPGAWVYFVKCQTDGTSCFSETLDEHEAARRDALARGVY